MANGIRKEVLENKLGGEAYPKLLNGKVKADYEHETNGKLKGDCMPIVNGKRKGNGMPKENGKQMGHYADAIRHIAENYNVPATAVIPVINCKDEKFGIIIYSDSINKERRENFAGCGIILKNQNIVSPEARNVIEKCQSQNCYLARNQRNVMEEIIQKYARDWFSLHSNLNIISTSPVKSRGGGMEMNHPCIVLYCTSKGYIPVGENEFPRTVSMGNQTVDIDVREGHFRFGYNTKASNLRHDTLRMGCEFSKENHQYSGTIGPFVEYEEQLAFLTCAHNIFEIDKDGYDNRTRHCVVQPGWTNNTQLTDRCGQARRAVFSPNSPNTSVDAAVVVISDRIPYRGEFAIAREWQYKMAGFDDIPHFNSGRIHDDPATIDDGVRIVKFGAATHVTKGILHSQGTVVRLDSQNCQGQITMNGQMEVHGVHAETVFALAGDSGSGVFYVADVNGRQELVCIGMLIGSTSYGNGIVTPIADILKALEITPGILKSFPSAT